MRAKGRGLCAVERCLRAEEQKKRDREIARERRRNVRGREMYTRERKIAREPDQNAREK